MPSQNSRQKRAAKGRKRDVDKNKNIHSRLRECKRAQQRYRMKDSVHHLREERDAEGFMGVSEGELKISQCFYNERSYGLKQLRDVRPDQGVA